MADDKHTTTPTRSRGSWMPRSGGTWTSPTGNVVRAAPLGAHSPERHRAPDTTPVTRDDAPPDAGTPEFLSGDRVAWLAAGGADSTSAVGGHAEDAGGDHARESRGIRHVDAPDTVDYAHTTRGGHVPAELKGAGGAAHGGLRPDGSMPWANPDGFRLGNEYQPQVTQRAMGHGRMRGALRALGVVRIETGSTPSPSPGGRTSQFDPTADAGGFGPSAPTSRHVLRPNGDAPAEAPNLGTIGDGLML